MRNVSVRLEDEDFEWLNEQVKEGRFSSMAHGIRSALKNLREPSLMVEICGIKDVDLRLAEEQEKGSDQGRGNESRHPSLFSKLRESLSLQPRRRVEVTWAECDDQKMVIERAESYGPIKMNMWSTIHLTFGESIDNGFIRLSLTRAGELLIRIYPPGVVRAMPPQALSSYLTT